MDCSRCYRLVDVTGASRHRLPDSKTVFPPPGHQASATQQPATPISLTILITLHVHHLEYLDDSIPSGYICYTMLYLITLDTYASDSFMYISATTAYLYIYNTQYFWIHRLYSPFIHLTADVFIFYMTLHVLSLSGIFSLIHRGYVYYFSILLFLAYFLRTAACHVTSVSLFRMALCCDVQYM